MFVQARRWAMVVGAASLALIGCGGGASRHSASAGTAAPTSRRADAALATRFQHALDTARASIDSPGASAAVLIPGQPLWAGTSGFADVRSHRRVTPGALFEIASVTKTLTAALVLKLTERHVLSLDDHLSRWVPEFPNADRITLRELLAHTAGTRDFFTVAFDRAQRRAGPDSTWPAERTLHYATRPIGGPGRQWSYSNTDYLLLGLVIERATHSTIAEQLHRRLLPRGDFPRLVFQGAERPTGAVATGYEDVNGDFTYEAFKGHPFIPSREEATTAGAAGSVAASATDLARALHGILAGNLISAASRRAMTTWVKTDLGGHEPNPNGFTPPEYGLGLAHIQLAGQDAWGHPGGITGFHAEAWYLPKTGVTIVALANLEASPAVARNQDQIARDLAAVVRPGA
jgi:D-alanyl-D-alanine carboxypeptidase